MLNRRNFTLNVVGLTAALLSSSRLLAHNRIAADTWFMPEEQGSHLRTWMAFIANEEIWHPGQIKAVQQNLLLIASTIAKYEPVNMLVRAQDYSLASAMLAVQPKSNFPISFVECEFDDLWLRDSGPVFVINGSGEQAAIDFNFNGWGNKQQHQLDAKVASFIAAQAQVKRIISSIVMEGGCFELDGAGTAIMTESCIINDNRNPGKTKLQIERELKQLLNLRKIIWLKGVKGSDITDAHTDFYARFAFPGVLVVSRDNDSSSPDYQLTRDNIEYLKTVTDASGRSLELVIMDTPETINTRFGEEQFAAGYLGYYLCNNAIIMQKFGDMQADNAALETMQDLFPSYHIEQIAVDAIASGGGTIHCATQQQPQTYTV